MNIIEAIRSMEQGAKMDHMGTKLQLGDAITLDEDIIEGWEVVAVGEPRPSKEFLNALKEAEGRVKKKPRPYYSRIYEHDGYWVFVHCDKVLPLHEATSIVGFDSIVYERGVPVQVVFES